MFSGLFGLNDLAAPLTKEQREAAAVERRAAQAALQAQRKANQAAVQQARQAGGAPAAQQARQQGQQLIKAAQENVKAVAQQQRDVALEQRKAAQATATEARKLKQTEAKDKREVARVERLNKRADAKNQHGRDAVQQKAFDVQNSVAMKAELEKAKADVAAARKKLADIRAAKAKRGTVKGLFGFTSGLMYLDPYTGIENGLPDPNAQPPQFDPQTGQPIGGGGISLPPLQPPPKGCKPGSNKPVCLFYTMSQQQQQFMSSVLNQIMELQQELMGLIQQIIAEGGQGAYQEPYPNYSGVQIDPLTGQPYPGQYPGAYPGSYDPNAGLPGMYSPGGMPGAPAGGPMLDNQIDPAMFNTDGGGDFGLPSDFVPYGSQPQSPYASQPMQYQEMAPPQMYLPAPQEIERAELEYRTSEPESIPSNEAEPGIIAAPETVANVQIEQEAAYPNEPYVPAEDSMGDVIGDEVIMENGGLFGLAGQARFIG